MRQSRFPASKLIRKQTALRSVLLLVLLGSLLGSVRASATIPAQGEINGRPVTLLLDTGSDFSSLFRRTAERLGLKIEKSGFEGPLQPGRVHYDLTEECTWTSGTFTQVTKFPVIDDLPTAFERFEMLRSGGA
jgi:hypothetical protein